MRADDGSQPGDAFDALDAGDLVDGADARARVRAHYEKAVEFLRTEEFGLRRRRYRYMEKAIAEQGGQAVRAAITQLAARACGGHKHILELFHLTAAIEQGMTPGEYLESESAASWLQRHSAESDRKERP